MLRAHGNELVLVKLHAANLYLSGGTAGQTFELKRKKRCPFKILEAGCAAGMPSLHLYKS